MSPLPHNDNAPELTAAQALSLASRLRDRIAVMDGPVFGVAVQQFAKTASDITNTRKEA